MIITKQLFKSFGKITLQRIAYLPIEHITDECRKQ